MSDWQHHTPAQALTRALNHLQDRVGDPSHSEAAGPRVWATEYCTYFSFTLGEFHWMVGADRFCELVVAPEMAPLPNAPALLLGIYNRRGDMVPVFSLHRLIDAGEPSTSRVLLLGHGSETVGLLVDSLPVSLELETSARRDDNNAAPEALRCLCEGHHLHEGIHWLCLNGGELGKQLLKLSWETEPAKATG